jgi:GNAT superfamily N-acetyltransferase
MDKNLISSIINNLYHQKLQYAITPYCESINNDYYKGIITKEPFSQGNQIYLAQLNKKNADKVISNIIKLYKKRRVSFSWYVGPLTKPENLGQHLLSHGFNLSGSYPCLACELEKINDSFSKPTGLEIKLVQDDETMKKWSKILVCSFNQNPSRHQIDLCYIFESKLGYKENLGRFRYLCYLNGDAVGTSLLFLNSGVAGIHCVGTIPQERGKGIGTSMSLHCLKEGKEKGYFFGVLRASNLGLNIYKKIGFKKYCNIDIYNWARAPHLRARNLVTKQSFSMK